ncbi:Amyotrophic lateral sclerosis 2 chromosomal region candidate gene 12 protein-like protein [Sciurus carolinensis]|uniref:Amyotrophic lateral sclerosis 2 chromosomal region candidate gene 12 protein-like protein n=1 Tax=Sciurus carolinensis TaxID=30640 RepID=A0AA41T9T5_SCICA|nr:Amyotrophic lateral sclerosis 2 chromosomal region candidate gene 12 protein-like protein [Sciurus carolinensis]
MYPNPLIYCTCWDPWNLGPRKLIKTRHPPNKAPTGRCKLTPLLPAAKEQNYLKSQQSAKSADSPKVKTNAGKQEESSKSSYEVINVSPGYQLARNREQISVTLGDEMFGRKKQLESEMMDNLNMSRTDTISNLEEQISELTALIEQMNRDHQAAQKLLSNEMELRCAEMKQNFENKNKELRKSHRAELSELENNYKEALKAEKAAARGKLGTVRDWVKEQGRIVVPRLCGMRMEFTFHTSSTEGPVSEGSCAGLGQCALTASPGLPSQGSFPPGAFVPPQDSIYDEIEEKWLKRKAEWEKEEKLEREKILLQQKHKMTKKFELESEEEKRKLTASYSASIENLISEKEIMEEELHAQAAVLESLNAQLYQTQMEFQKEKATWGNLEKTFQTKFAETEEKYKHTVQILREENVLLRCGCCWLSYLQEWEGI